MIIASDRMDGRSGKGKERGCAGKRKTKLGKDRRRVYEMAEKERKEKAGETE